MAGPRKADSLAKVLPEVEIAVERAFAGLSPRLSIEQATELMAHGAVEIVLPAEAIALSRLWRRIDRTLGPGKTLLNALAAAYPPVADIVVRLEKVYAFAASALAPRSRLERARAELNRLMPEIERVQAEIATALDKNASTLNLRDPDKKQVLADAVAGYKQALEELKSTVRQRRDTLAAMAAEGMGARMRRERRNMVLTETARRSEGSAEQGAGDALKLLATFGDVARLGDDLRKKLAQVRGGTLVDEVWGLIGDDSLLFARALGSIAAARRDPAKWAALLQASKVGVQPHTLADGYLNQLRGLLPEEAAATLGALDALGKKRALELMADWPAALAKDAGKMSVEHVKGPFWTRSHTFSGWAEFGDGATLLHDPAGGGAYLVLLGESKAYLPYKLFQQLFGRSDPRFAGQLVHYIDQAGQLRSVLLKPLPGTAMPTYVFSRPRGMTGREQERLARIVEADLRDGREVLKMDLPFTREHNEAFATMLFGEAIRMLEKLGRK